MKLYYFKDDKGNFGDDLNPWLWNKLLPNFFDDDETEIFVGIGTLINHRLPAHPIKHIFGSGFGYGTKPKIDDRFIFHALRGYKTAEALGIDKSKVITDSAILIRNIDLSNYRTKKEYKYGLMLTGYSLANYEEWDLICNKLSFNFISCHWEVDKVLQEILKCDILISEAMHGAIIADALRIPWLPVDFYNYVLDFKWEDWLSTINIPYNQNRIEGPFSKKNISFFKLINSSLRGLITKKNSELNKYARSKPEHINKVIDELYMLTTKKPYLSQDSVITSLNNRYNDLLENFKRKSMSRLI